MRYTRAVIVIAGIAGAGKDTVAERLSRFLSNTRRDAYAAPLKMCVHLKTGISMDVLNGTQAEKEDPANGRYGKTPRKLMQEEGEEARQRIGLTVWVDRLVERAVAAPESITVVSDGRHPEEELVQLRARLPGDYLCVSVRVVRLSVLVQRGHPSEDRIADADNSLFDYILDNDGTLDLLYQRVQRLADSIFVWMRLGDANMRAVRETPFDGIRYGR